MANGYVEAPLVEAAPFGLLTAVPVVNHTSADEHWAANTGVSWISEQCGYKVTILDVCDDIGNLFTVHDPGAPPDPADQTAPTFAIFFDDLCTSTFGLKEDEKKEKITRAALARTQIAVETRLLAHFVTVGATDVSGSTDIVGQLGDLEQNLGCGSGTAGLIYMSRKVATQLAAEGAIEIDGDKLKTNLGTTVVASHAFGDSVMYGTGPATAHLGPVVLYSVLDQETNDMVYKAERPAAVVWDSCCLVSVTVP